MTNGQAAAGWYPDHSDASRLRYWDGQRWTEHTAPVQPAAPIPNAAHFASPAATPHGVPSTTSGQSWFIAHKGATIAIAIAAAFVLIGAIGAAAGSAGSDDDKSASAATEAESSDSVAAEPVEAEPSASEKAVGADETDDDASPSSTPSEEPVLSVQDKFIAIVTKAHDVAESGNEIAVVQARKDRGRGICALLGPSLTVKGWEGSVESVETELGGDDGVLSIAITDDFAVQTWNNSFSDIGSGTLIDPGSAVYRQLAQLEEGDEVIFAGRFVSESGNCVQEQSLIDENGLLTPDFSFKFASVREK